MVKLSIISFFVLRIALAGEQIPVSSSTVEMEDILIQEESLSNQQKPSQRILLNKPQARERITLDQALEGESLIQITPTPQQGNTISLNGMHGEHIAIFQDGDPVLGRIDGALNARSLSLGNASQVSIYEGLDALPYGSQNIGGVIHLESPWNATSQQQAKAGYGSFEKILMEGLIVHQTPSQQTFTLHAEGWRGDAIRSDPQQVDTAVPANARTALHGSWVKPRLMEWNNKPIAFRIGSHFQKEHQSGYVLQSPYETHQKRVHVFSDLRRGHSNFHLSFNQHQHDFSGFSSTGLQERLWRFGPDLQETWASWTVFAGSIAEFQSIESSRLSTTPPLSWNQGSYLGARYGFAEHWTAGLGSRYDSRVKLWSPKAELQYHYQKHTVSLEPAFGFREPTAKERYMLFTNPVLKYQVTGNERLNTERSFNLRLQHSYQRKEASFHTAVFQTTLRNAIGFAPDPDNPSALTYSNLTQTRTRGFSENAEYGFFQNWKISSQYQWLKGVNGMNGSELFLQPNHRISIGLHRNVVHGFSFSTLATWTASQGLFDYNRNQHLESDEKIPAFWSTSLHASYGFYWDELPAFIRIFGRLENVLNVVRQDALPAEPRNWFFGTSFEL